MELQGPYTKRPPSLAGVCSIDVLIKNDGWFCVGYFCNGNWYVSFTGERLPEESKPRAWYKLPD